MNVPDQKQHKSFRVYLATGRFWAWRSSHREIRRKSTGNAILLFSHLQEEEISHHWHEESAWGDLLVQNLTPTQFSISQLTISVLIYWLPHAKIEILICGDSELPETHPECRFMLKLLSEACTRIQVYLITYSIRYTVPSTGMKTKRRMVNWSLICILITTVSSQKKTVNDMIPQSSETFKWNFKYYEITRK